MYLLQYLVSIYLYIYVQYITTNLPLPLTPSNSVLKQRFYFILGFYGQQIWFMVVLPTCGLSTPRIVQHGWTTLRIAHCNVYPPDRFDHHFSNGLTTNSHRLFRFISGDQTVSPQRTPGKVNKWSKYSKKCLKRDSNSRPPGQQTHMLTIRPWKFGVCRAWLSAAHGSVRCMPNLT